MQKFLFIFVAFTLFSCGKHWFPFDDSISEGKMIEALQEALVLGSRTAASNLGDGSCTSSLAAAGDCTTGYLGNKLVEIALPDTVKNVLGKIETFSNDFNALPTPIKTAIGSQLNISNLSGIGKNIKEALNRGAEQAAPASVEVFKNAIFGMSIGDAKKVLLGNETAATSYLHTNTYDGLQSVFSPFIKTPLDKLNPNQYWSNVASNYNKFANSYKSVNVSNLPVLPYNNLPEDLSNYLADYATGKALDGLFIMVSKQESELRADPWGTVGSLGKLLGDGIGDLLGDVFGKAKEGTL